MPSQQLFPTIWTLLRQVFQGNPGAAVDTAHQYAQITGRRNQLWLATVALTFLFSGLSFAIFFRQASYYLAEAAQRPGTGILPDAMHAIGFFTDGFSFGDLVMAMLFILAFFLVLMVMRPLAVRSVLHKSGVEVSPSEARTLLAISMLPVLPLVIIAPLIFWLEGFLGFLPLVITAIALLALVTSAAETLLWSAIMHISASHLEPGETPGPVPVVLHAILSAATLLIVLAVGTFLAWPVLVQLYL